MISKEDINKLANLSRIEIGEAEAEKLGGEIEAILGYVGQVSNFTAFTAISEDESAYAPDINVMREDINPTLPGTHTEAIVAEFPHAENGYLKVKKIL